jgi:hypothetical protein
MPRFYFHLTSKDSRISDDRGKELSSLTDAHGYAQKLVEKIWLYTSHEDTEEWNVTVSNDDFDAWCQFHFPIYFQSGANLVLIKMTLN